MHLHKHETENEFAKCHKSFSYCPPKDMYKTNSPTSWSLLMLYGFIFSANSVLPTFSIQNIDASIPPLDACSVFEHVSR